MSYLFTCLAVVWAIILMFSKQKTLALKTRLSFFDIAQIVIISIFTPVLGGAILYFGWRKYSPQTAKQVVLIAGIVLVLQILVAGVVLAYLLYGN